MVDISDSPDPVPAGQDLVYTIVVTNNGPDAATGVIMTQALPPGVTFVSATPDQGSCAQSNGTVTCDLAGLATGATTTITVVVTTTGPGTLTTTASVGGNEFDSDLGNNTDAEASFVPGATFTPTRTAGGTSTPTPTPTPVDAQCRPLIRKVHAGIANPGGLITYTLLWSNPCDTVLHNVVVSDKLPDGLVLVAAAADSSAVTISILSNTVTFAVATLVKGPANTATISAQIDASVAPTTLLINTASLRSDEFPTPSVVDDPLRVRGGVVDPHKLSCALNAQQLTRPEREITFVARYQRGSALNTITLSIPISDLEVLKVQPPATSVIGGLFTWTNLNNTSGLVKVKTRVTPVVPDGAQLNATATVNDGLGSLVYCDNQSVVDRGDRLFVKLRGQAKAAPGRLVTYSIQYRDAIGNNEMTLSLPADSNVLSIIPPATSQQAGVLTWINLPVPAGPVKVKTQVSAQAVAGSVLSASTTMSDSTGNVARATTETQVGAAASSSGGTKPGAGDLSVGIDGPGHVIPDSRLSYTLTATVLGNAVASDIVLRNDLPAGLTYRSAIPAPTSALNGMLTWSLGEIQGPAIERIKVIVDVAASAGGSTVVNKATLVDGQGHSASSTQPVSVR